jgi:hypothetical protein
MSKRIALIIVGVLLLLTAVVNATQPCFNAAENDTITALLNQYEDYTKKALWSDAARLIYPQEIDGLKEVMANGADLIIPNEGTGKLNALFGDTVNSGADIRKLDNIIFFDIFMSLVADNIPGFLDMLKSGTMNYLGSVCESDTKAYAVIKATFIINDAPIESADIVPLRKDAGGKWMVGFKSTLKSLAESIFK